MEKKTTKKVSKKKTNKKVVKKEVKSVKDASKTKSTVKNKVANKPAPKKVESTPKVEKTVEKEEPWYIWLKNNIIENEEKYSKEYKNRRLVVALFMIFCFFSVLFSTAIIDYNYAYRRNGEPVFVIRKRDEYKQATIYYGMFYKAWKCDNGFEHINFARYKTKISYCSLVTSYDEDGVYTNPNGVKISQSQMNVIKNYYYDDYVYFKTAKDLENAYTISKEIDKIWWVRKSSDEVIDNDDSIGLAIFGKIETANGVDEWKLQYNDPEYYRCVKNVDGSNVFAKYNHLDNTCDTSWESLSLNEDTCNLIDSSSEFVQNLVKLTGLCK